MFCVRKPLGLALVVSLLLVTGCSKKDKAEGAASTTAAVEGTGGP